MVGSQNFCLQAQKIYISKAKGLSLHSASQQIFNFAKLEGASHDKSTVQGCSNFDGIARAYSDEVKIDTAHVQDH